MKPEVKKLILLNLPYLLFVYLFGKVGQAFRLAHGIDLSAKLLHIGQGFTAAFASAAPSFHPVDLLIGIAGAVIIRLVVYSKQKNAKKYRKGMEYGTARWGTPADIKPFIDPVFENNVLLTQTERLMMSNRPKDPKNARNKNILVIGGSGSGKTRFFAKPNIMQLHSSYVITDPKGSLICEVGQLLQRAKYRIKVLNTINFSKSMHYNPFAYLRSEKDILKLVKQIRYVSGQAVIPIGYIQAKAPLYKRREVNQYTEQGRRSIHKNLESVNMSILHYLMRNPVQFASVELNNNRLALYCAQHGCCAVTKQPLEIGDIHCHHKLPREKGGNDQYGNLVLVTETVHILIHATDSEVIARLVQTLRLNVRQRAKLNTISTP